MTAGETVNLWGSAVALTGSLTFVAVYSLFARWWRDPIGRLLVYKALAISVFMALSVIAYTTDADLTVLRLVRGIIAAAFGLLMLYQAWFVGHTQITGARRGPDNT
jgi:FtsH-binding integral membrane protein